ncbi:hypothetical protein A1019T_00619 [Psychrobacter pasteurii]|uniref:Lipoprotein n=1 Tax=Psychrobacter pasteurii TaxID=1945520 RepID=A0A1R4EDT9_9GAMM|nr:hypothetical protein [Psychrobacter pasteurii]SJM36656.1 hypothetical protein A1019T_00619 [Psychrobacter pasteurii]
MKTLSKKPYFYKKKNKLAALSLAIPLALSACQVAPSSNQNVIASKISQLPVEQQSQMAKDTLFEALKKKSRSDYAYQVNVLGSNEQRRERLSNATPQQLAMSDNPINHCEHVHDEAYVDLLQRAEQSGLEIYNAKYSAERQSIKQAYQQCVAALEAPYSQESYEQWLQKALEQANIDLAKAEAGIKEEAIEEQDSLNEQELTDDFQSPDEAIEEQDSLNEQELTDDFQSPDTVSLDTVFEDIAESVLPGYDASHTKLDARKAKLLNAYLLNPTNLTASGVYRASNGKVSIMPTIAYQSRNLQLLNSHFIYMDARQGAVYVWADTFAYLLSSSIDPNLGLTFKNKWIKININDGSLPKNFLPDLLKAHLLAKDKMHVSTSADQYRFISTSDLQNNSPKPDTKHQPYLKDASLMIERKLTKQQYEKEIQLYLTTVYDQMTQKYPQLLEVKNSNEEQSSTGENSTQTLSSKYIFTQIFKAIEKLKQDSSSSKLEDSITTKTVESNHGEAANDNKPNIEYAVKDAKLAEHEWLWRNVYGLDSQQRIVWQLGQHQLDSNASALHGSNDLLTRVRLEVLTRYTKASATIPIFEVLPTGASMPSKSNSVDIKNYFENLKLSYDKGEGSEQGKVLFETLK